MLLVNETHQVVSYRISTGSLSDKGTIEVNGVADLAAYDNQTDVSVEFRPEAGAFSIDIGNTQSGEQVEIAVLAK